MSNTAIKIEGVSKRYELGAKASNTLRQALSNIFSRKNKKESFLALDNISLNINKGQAIGIIGKNGAGKSTLLKILSKITFPTKGRIELYGRVTSLLEVGTGFHPELTGSENIYLNGSLLGMSKVEIQEKFDEIILFSGVHKFIDTPIKHYSSGMQMRLAFAVAAHLNSEILLVDEVLAVGDYEFRKKCIEKMNSLSTESNRTVLFVSHNLTALEDLCDTSILLDNGKIIKQGKTRDVVKFYKNDMLEDLGIASISDYRQHHRSQEVIISNISALKKHAVFTHDEDLIFNLELTSEMSFTNLLVEFHIYNESSDKVIEIYSWDADTKIDINNEKRTFSFDMGSMRLSAGRYFVDLKLKNAIGASAMDFIQMFPLFEMKCKADNLPKVKTDRGGYLTVIPKLTAI